MTSPTIILGSQSPRRNEILSFFSLPFKQISSGFDESTIPFTGDPYHYVKELSDAKADSLADLYPNEIILTADTIVYKDGKVYGKPNDKNELFVFLKELEGSWHTVFTSLTLRQGSLEYQQTEETRVLFNQITESQLESYSKKLPWQDKAGGYMVQLAGSLIVKKIEGCFYNIMGLPMNTLQDLLKKIGIDLWSYLKAEISSKD